MFFRRIQLADNPFCKNLTWVVLTAFLFSTACTSAKTLTHQPDSLQNVVKKGDFVEITTKDGDKIELRIVELTPGAIKGNKTEQGIL